MRHSLRFYSAEGNEKVAEDVPEQVKEVVDESLSVESSQPPSE